MKKITNEIVLTKQNQGDNLAKVLGETILTLLSEDQILTVRDDDVGIIVIEHEHNNYIDAWGGPTPVWLEDDEFEMIEDYRFEKEAAKNSDSDDEFFMASTDKGELLS